MRSRYINIFKVLKGSRRSFFPEYYILLLFHRLTVSSTQTSYKIQARCVGECVCVSACQPPTRQQTSSGCIITDMALALAPTGRAEIYAYPWFNKWICVGVWYSMVYSAAGVKLTGRSGQSFYCIFTLDHRIVLTVQDEFHRRFIVEIR
jgi:hypothetical protein